MVHPTSRFVVVLTLALGIAAAGILIVSNHVLADQSAQTSVRIGLVGNPSALDATAARLAFREQLKSLGYVEGRNLYLEERWANGDTARLPELIVDLVQRKVDVLVATSTHAARAAKQATSTVPVVMVFVADPVGTGLVANLAHPEGNLTGLSLMTIDLSAKRVQILKDAIPRIARVAVLWNPDHPLHPKVVEALKLNAPSLSIELTFVDVRTPEQLVPAFSTMRRAHVQALYVIEDPVFFVHRAKIAQLASKARLVYCVVIDRT
jgi:putative ABC transport system substrate-binding protein